jgi:hypothetical protein
MREQNQLDFSTKPEAIVLVISWGRYVESVP